MDAAGYGKDVLKQIRTLIDAEGSDLLDVLEYISFNIEPIQRTERVKKADGFRASLNATSQDFINYIIQLYVKEGIDELGPDKLPAIRIAAKMGYLKTLVTDYDTGIKLLNYKGDHLL
jgi:type I restriction enzyme R subunit